MKVALCSWHMILYKFLEGDELLAEVEEVADIKDIY